MKTVVIACRVMEPELTRAFEQTGVTYPIEWMESGLHERPKILHGALAEKIAEAEEKYAPEQILMAYGFCGNAMAGLRSKTCRLILPRGDDCITLFIGSRARKRELEGGLGTMFLTGGWLEFDVDILRQRQELIDEYGEEDGLDVFNMMYGNYKQIGLLDTHCAPLPPLLEKTQALARELHFEHQVFDGSNERLRRLLTGPWTEELFVIKAPGEAIAESELTEG